MQNTGYYKKVNQYLYATKYRDFCLKGGDEDFSLRLSEFNLLFYLGTKEQEEMAQKFIKHLLQKINMQILMLKLQNEINEYESRNSSGS
ncbi:hypothetical protein G17_00580 [Escherichia phage vB_EcoM_G17]|uniref:Phage protein n=1 Tax=Escherichia phage SP27 TaxID=2495557 RepID=A0A5A4U7M4_9CAUD|nr:hypothetical protein [Escherichia coli]MED6924669.1 hypothetical protein [Escherichia coli O157]QBO62069.1 hypothetical protein G17_00580 [Escherichia phage vB_EcoM_G17]WNN14307.1 hypothetical protein Sharanji_gp019 [Escherichia phage Sharanji]BBM61913.1 hypothetical protein EO157G_3240 [Escherichia phage SP27]EFF2105639.1 hypothetical protein [Escherichia coli]